ncbi:MAG: type II secretion system protein M [Gammaproteobacteria bacterium]|nr:type II secretion system protein M [Gammaproteobacteria bacterium]
MNELWIKASQQVNALSLREKILLLLAGFIVIPYILDFFLLQPLRDNASEWRQQTDIIRQSLASFSEQQNDLLVEIKKDPAMELERKIEGIEGALESAQQALRQYTDTLIAPQRMASMLENMLHERGDLKLVSLHNLPVAPLFKGQEPNAGQSDEEKQVDEDVFGLYRHGIQLVFKGNYMSTKDYLANLEKLPWKFYWQSFNYEVQKYPTAVVQLNIYTLSTSKWWIGDKND